MLKVDTIDTVLRSILHFICTFTAHSINSLTANCTVSLLLTDDISMTNVIIRCVRWCVWFSSCTYNNHVLGTYNITGRAYIDFVIHRFMN